jgi:hypothetical protein
MSRDVGPGSAASCDCMLPSRAWRFATTPIRLRKSRTSIRTESPRPRWRRFSRDPAKIVQDVKAQARKGRVVFVWEPASYDQAVDTVRIAGDAGGGRQLIGCR